MVQWTQSQFSRLRMHADQAVFYPNQYLTFTKDGYTKHYYAVTQGFVYAPFGEIVAEYQGIAATAALPKYAFNAKELDEESGMYYYEARYYAPPVFTSRDPHFERYFWTTPYGYCNNNPLKYVDPTGMDWYQDADGNAVFNKNVNEKSQLGEGEKYIGKTASWMGQSENDMNIRYTGDENGNVTSRDMTMNVHPQKDYSLSAVSVGMSGVSIGAGFLGNLAGKSKSTFRMTNSKGGFDFHYYNNGWKGNQWVTPTAVSKIGKGVKDAGNVAGVIDMILNVVQMLQASTIDGKFEYGLDLLVDAFAFTREGALFALYWNFGGKQLHWMYVEKVLLPQIQMGINPGLIQYQPSK